MTVRRTTLLGATAASVAVGAVLTLTVGPAPPDRPRRVSGDRALATRVVEALDGARGVRSVSVALVEDGGARVTFAGLDGPDARPGPRGPLDEHTPFEIGSVTKGLTGMLLADAAGRGEVDPGAAASTVVPGLGRATLAELAAHRSGLPRLPTSPADWARTLGARLTAGDPYRGDAADVLGAARAEGADGGADFAYSNLGAATLGQVLGTRLGRPYPQLLSERVLRPLGMTATTVATSRAQLPAGRATGSTANGRRPAEWVAAGYAPAGVGVWSTAADLSRLVTALMRDDAPGAAAAVPRTEAGDGRRIGFGWFTGTSSDRNVVWHNGGTGGFRAFVGFDPAAGRGVVLLAATDVDVDGPALELLTGSRS